MLSRPPTPSLSLSFLIHSQHMAKMEPLPKPNKTAILGKLKAFEAIVIGRLNDTLHSKDGF